MKYVFIGGGNMGQALVKAMLSQRICAAGDIHVVDPAEPCRSALASLGCAVSAEPLAGIGAAPVLVLAVKPQSAEALYGTLRPLLDSSQVVVSIMAGVTLAAIQAGLEHQAVVRVMPNTPAQIGLGMNVYFRHPAVSDGQARLVREVLEASGAALAVSSEDAIDAATAISGSGPAYLFFFAEHCLAAARSLGFSESDAALLVQQTFEGATALWRQGSLSAGELRERVTSKGGTTAAALEYFQSHGAGEIIQDGLRKAYQRAKELGS